MGDHPGPRPPGASRADIVAAVGGALRDLPRGACAVAALSGGPDSTALAYLAAEARPDLSLVLVHVRHGLRDDREDLRVVATHADWSGLPLQVVEVEVRPTGEGVAAAARRERYAALRRVAARTGATAILVGHTADDQAETVLQRLARGTGVDGLAGMRVRSGDLVRPLLGLRRSDVHGFVLMEGLPTVADPSNDDPATGRARARHRVLPLLRELGPDPVGALARLADLAHDDARALASWAAEVAAGARRVGPVLAIADEVLDAVPAAVAHRVLRALVAETARTADHAPAPLPALAVARLASLAPGAALDLPGGVRATAGGGWRALAPRTLPRQEPVPVTAGARLAWEPAAVSLAWHGPDAGAGEPAQGQIAFELAGAWTPPRLRVDPAVVPPGGRAERATLALPEGLPPLWVRHRRPGDRVALPAGHRRLKEVLIDAGVPRPVREVWPVVATSEGRIVWVPGVAADREVVAAGRERPAALLALARGPG